MKNKTLYLLYYLVLMLILVRYSNMQQSPSTIYRFGFLAALVLPLINKVGLFPAIIICALGISYNSYAYMIMPTGIWYYVVLAAGFSLLVLIHKKSLPKPNLIFYIALIYIALNDLILQGHLSEMAVVFFIFLLLFNCLEGEDIGMSIMPMSFILISLAISYWRLFCPEAQINSYNLLDDMVQTGWTDPNYLSGALGIGLVLAVRELLNGTKKLLYIALLSITVIGASISILLLASRGAILSAVFAIAALILVSNNKTSTKVLAIIIAVWFVYILNNNQYLDFVLARFENEDGTGTFRTEIWQSKLTEFFAVDNPTRWIFGIGQTDAMQLGTYMGDSRVAISTHNDFISMLLYYGFIGLFFLIYVLVYPIRKCQKAERPQIIVLILYFALSIMTIEPIAQGNYVFWGFLFYIMMLARQGHQGSVERNRR